MRRMSCGWLSLAVMSSAQAGVSFQFTYGDAGTGFNDPVFGETRRAALEEAASALGGHFPDHTATLAMTVSSFTVNSPTLATGSSPMAASAGFKRTVAQQKVIAGNDLNGAGAADGSMSFNFFHAWSYGDAVGDGTYDFQGVAMHELVHALGFTTLIKSTGQGGLNAVSGQPDMWTRFDEFLTTTDGTRLVTADFRYDTSLGTAPLTGDPGVFFSGANAMAAFGGRVPIFSPSPFQSGSSLGHTDELMAGGVGLMMNPGLGTGPAPRTFTQVEMGILRDLGFAVVPEPGEWGLGAAAGLLIFTAWRRAAGRGPRAGVQS